MIKDKKESQDCVVIYTVYYFLLNYQKRYAISRQDMETYLPNKSKQENMLIIQLWFIASHIFVNIVRKDWFDLMSQTG